ncbi:MAG: hypothetical protein ACP5I8_11255 [Phycisphaerae bacterium]
MIESPTTRATPANTPAKATPPLWLAERVVLRLGRVPAAAGRFLDRLASYNGPVGWLTRFFSSITLGLVWLFLTTAYIAIGSGLPSVRSYFDVSTMGFFNSPPMVILMILLATTLIVVTLRRIPLTLYKLGVWTVHVGIITLLVGLFLYFGLKKEGMVRIFLHQTVHHYYDDAERALYMMARNAHGQSAMLPLPSLPLFRERSTKNHHPLDIAVPPEMVRQLSPGLAGVRVRVIGYYPYTRLEALAVQRQPGQPARQPALEFNLSATGMASGGQWLLAKTPRLRVADAGLPCGIEYLYHPSARRLRDISTSFKGNNAIIVSVPADHFHRVLVIHPHEKMVLPGTPYTLIPRQEIKMPLLSKGYRGASSQAYIIDVYRADGDGKTFHFQRAALFRYPTQTVDFVFQHGRRKLIPDKIDQAIHIRYEDARRYQFWIVEHKSGQLTVVQRAAGGAVTQYPIAIGHPAATAVAGIPFNISVQELANVVYRPETIPAAQRAPQLEQTMGHCVLQLAVSKGRWTDRQIFLPFQQFGLHGDLAATRVAVPGVGPVSFVFSTLQWKLPAALTLLACKELFYPGGNSFPRDFISKVRFTNLKTGKSKIAVIHLNHPETLDGQHFFQARFGRRTDGTPFTVLGVGNTNGLYPMIAGVIMIIFGIGYAFYVKPVLLNMKKRDLARLAALHKAAGESAAGGNVTPS